MNYVTLTRLGFRFNKCTSYTFNSRSSSSDPFRTFVSGSDDNYKKDLTDIVNDIIFVYFAINLNTCY